MASLNAVTQTITGNKVTVSSIEEANKKLAEIKAKIQEIDKKNAELKEKYDAEVQKVNAYNQAQKEAYDKAYAKYQADLALYNKLLAEYEANKNKDGYLSVPSVQKLIFTSEPQAQHTVSTRPATQQEIKDISAGMPAHALYLLNSKNQPIYVLQKGQSITVTYTNLKNSTLSGTAIGKVVYTYTLKEAGYGDRLLAVFDQDPTKTLYYVSGAKNFKLNMDVKFYDKNDKLIDPTGALISFSSLNAAKPSGGDWEGVSDFTGEMIAINGSSISKQPDGTYKASTSNESKADGSKYDVTEWDKDGNPLEYFGAIAGRSDGAINFNILSDGRAYVWFAFNSGIKANGVPVEPTAPDQPTYQKLPKEPDYQKVEVPTIVIETAIHEVSVNKITELEVESPQLIKAVHDVIYDAPASVPVQTPATPAPVVQERSLPTAGDHTQHTALTAAAVAATLGAGVVAGGRKKRKSAE